MVAKQRMSQRGLRGPRGRKGARGPKGPKGPKGAKGLRGFKGAKSTNGDTIARLVAQMNQVLGELQIQLTRIAQLQAQLDHVTRGESPESFRPKKETEQ